MITNENLFRNPFEDINANVMDSKKILDFWCNPFTVGYVSEVTEEEFYTKKMPIIIEGARGSGKTTILKYFSADLQYEISERNNISFINQVKNDGGVGIYFRCDEAFIKTFKMIFDYNEVKEWTLIFEHYIELFLVNNLIDIIDKIENNLEIKKEIVSLLNIKFNKDFKDFKEFINFIVSQIYYIDSYKNNVIFTDEKFKPERIFSLYELSVEIIKIIKKQIMDLENVNFIFSIDEFENLKEDLQKVFNTYIKFSNNEISFRVGRRSEGLITTETFNKTEHLINGHDYILLSLLNENDNKKAKEYFEVMANKRLETYNGFSNIKLSDVLGGAEDILWEAKKISSEKKNHIVQILKTNNEFRYNDQLLNEVVEIISYNTNPIAEMLNALWVIRNKNKNKIEVAKEVKVIMLAALENSIKDDLNIREIKRYKSNYNDKYKYSLLILMSSIYHKRKLYYSFNTICYLSNNNARMFMNYCKAIFNDALFYEKKLFFESKTISPTIQSKAILEVSQEEFNNVKAIIKYGENIGNLVNNIGNVLSEFHRDKKVRYPETNQFFLDESNLFTDYKEMLNIAISWSIIIKKTKKQRTSVETNQKASLYYLNRSFCPIFNISYRTRGGYNPQFSTEEIEIMLKSLVSIHKIHTKHSEKSTPHFEQLELFSMGDYND